jgi:transposase
MATVLQAYRFALDPTPRKQGSLASHTGAALFAYNWSLELVTIRLDQRRAGEDVQVPWTLAELRREWNRAKHQVAPWWQQNSKEAYSSCRLVIADRFYPSSKTCSGCGWVKAKLPLAERTFRCEACGLQMDRDLNAARNLARLVQSVARSGWETQTARGADRKSQPAGQVAVKREAGTGPCPGETGTVQPQGSTA